MRKAQASLDSILSLSETAQLELISELGRLLGGRHEVMAEWAELGLERRKQSLAALNRTRAQLQGAGSLREDESPTKAQYDQLRESADPTSLQITRLFGTWRS